MLWNRFLGLLSQEDQKIVTEQTGYDAMVLRVSTWKIGWFGVCFVGFFCFVLWGCFCLFFSGVFLQMFVRFKIAWSKW